MFADDMVLIAKDGEELQQMIDVVQQFSHKWRFELSSAKSEVMVVGGDKSTVWMMGGSVLTVVDAFKYLGVDIQVDGRWNVMCKRLLDKTRTRADGMIGIGMRSAGFSVKTGAVMWESLLVPIAQYGAQIVW